MTSTVTRIDYDAARVRLEAVTNDRQVLEGFQRLVKNRDVDDAFLESIYRTGISLDYFLLGEGKPIVKKGARTSRPN